MDLSQVIYVSIAADKITSLDTVKILGESQANNKELGLTGMLLFAEGEFCQVLEGPSQNLELVLDRIQCDRRHLSMRIIFHEPVAERSFSNWAMGFEFLPVLNSAEMRDAFQISNSELDSRILNSVAKNVRTYMRTFYRLSNPGTQSSLESPPL